MGKTSKLDAFDRIRGEVKVDDEAFIELGLDFVEQIRYNMSIHPTIKTQKALAKALGKEESEISKWIFSTYDKCR